MQTHSSRTRFLVLVFLAACTVPDDAATERAELNGALVPIGSPLNTATVHATAAGACTATFISEKVVLLAAHCICGGDTDNPFQDCVKQGNVQLWNGTMMSGLRVAFHPDYSMNFPAGGLEYTNDLGALVLPAPAATSQGATIAAADTTTFPTVGQPTTLVGYGGRDGTDWCNGMGGGERFGTTDIVHVIPHGEEGIDLETEGAVHGCPGDSGGPMFDAHLHEIGVDSRGNANGGGTTYDASIFGQEKWLAALEHLGSKTKILDIAMGMPPTASVYTDTSTDTAMAGWLDSGDDQVVGDFARRGYDQLLLVDRGTTATGRAEIADFRDGVGDTELHYHELLGQSHVLDGFVGLGDRTISGDFMGDKASQALFVNTNPAAASLRQDRLLIGSFYGGAPPVNVRFREAPGVQAGFEQMIDAEDAIVAGDFYHLGHAQALFVNRSPGAAAANERQFIIAEFVAGPPAHLIFQARFGAVHGLEQMADPGDRVLVGDFMGYGWDQTLFINMDPLKTKGAPLIRIVDWHHVIGGPQIVYSENVGDRVNLDGMLDPEDVALAGNFLDAVVDAPNVVAGVQPAQVMFINTTPNPDPDSLYIEVLWFHSGVPDEESVAYQDFVKNVETNDPNLSNALDELSPLFTSDYLVRAGNFRGRKGRGRGHVQLLTTQRQAPVTKLP